jgi:hypothetical protein
MFRPFLRSALSLLCALTLLHCGNDPVQNGGLSQPLPLPGGIGDGANNSDDGTQLNVDVQLNGRYVRSVRIDGGTLTASEPGQDVELTFIASGLSNVKQFEMRLRLDPDAAFDLASSSFVPMQPFIAPPTTIERTAEGQWRTGGASVTRVVEGEATLGTIKLKTANGFDAGTQVRVQVEFFSIGPSFSDRDDYNANDLKLGVIVNE